MLRALDGLVGLANQVFARLREHLDGHVVGNQILLNQGAHAVVFRLRGRGEAHLNFLEAHAHQHFEHLDFFLDVHRLHQRLVAVGANPQSTRWAPFPAVGRAIGGRVASPVRKACIFSCASPPLNLSKKPSPLLGRRHTSRYHPISPENPAISAPDNGGNRSKLIA